MFYKLDSARVSFREYWWGTPNPLVIIAWILRLLRLRLPGSADDPNVDSLEPFRVSPDQLPEEARGRFHAIHTELQALGFHSPVCYWIHDARNQADICQAVYLHDSGEALARVHYRVWRFPKPAKVYFFPNFLTAFTDGTYLVSTAGRRDMLAPAACRENRRVKATATDLWTSHRAALQKELLFKTVRPVRQERELLQAVEAHHAVVRDFHIDRGVFVPMSEEEERTNLEAAREATAAAAKGSPALPQAQSLPQTSVLLEEIERLQNKRSGWGAGLLVLIVSVGLFLALGAAQWSWEFVAVLLPILFIHELGHYAAMRLFHYSNVKMFFIPLLGAAVSGRHYNVPGWKKVIVSLAGPLPGIFLGAGLGFAAAWFEIDWLHSAAMLAIGLNGFNLLPILPLDGGWVMHALLFSRHYILDAGFRILAVGVLLVGSRFAGDNFLFFFGLAMAAGLPFSFRMAGIVSAIRRQGISTASPDDQSIPPETAEAIAHEIRRRFPHGLTNRNIAQFTLQAFEALNARPPSILATIVLGTVYVGSFLFALAALALLTVGLPLLMSRGFDADHPVRIDEIELAGSDRVGELPKDEATIVATFGSADEAAVEFDALKEQLPVGATLVRFGQSLLVAVPPGGGTAEQWESRWKSQRIEVCNCRMDSPVGFSVAATAPSEEIAIQIQGTLEAYQNCSTWIVPDAPWHPESPPTPEDQHARESFARLMDMEEVYDDPRYKRLSEQISAAYDREDESRAGELEQELESMRKVIQEERLDEFRKKATNERDRDLIELCGRQPSFDFELNESAESGKPEPEAARAAREEAAEEYQKQLDAWQDELAEMLGGTARNHDPGESGTDRFGIEGGTIERNGRVIEMEYVSVSCPVDAAPAIVRWLDGQGCTEIKYSFLCPD